MPEKEEIEKAKAGKNSAFEKLVSMYEKRLYYTALAIVNNTSDAEDAVQETFVNAFRFIKNFKGESSFYTWLSSILINNCRRILKQRKRWYLVLTGYSKREKKHENELVSSWKEKDQNLYLVGKIMEKMGIQERELIYYLYFENMKYKEIAQIFHCSIGTVKSRVFYAKKKFREIFVNEQKNLLSNLIK